VGLEHERSRIYVLGKATTEKVFEVKTIFTVPLLISCPCVGEKVRLESIIRNAGKWVPFHWSKETLKYVRGVRKRVKGMAMVGKRNLRE
jgi:hypothetical protein